MADGLAMEQQTDTHGQLLVRARKGDEMAWNTLVDRMTPLVWSVTRSFRFDHATATDVAQTVWLKLLENCDRINDPEKLPGWLATTCRREALRVKGDANRTLPTEFEYDVIDTEASVEDRILDDEEQEAVRWAFETLSADDQKLLRLMTVEPALTYEEIAELVERPVGSLGPTRGRALDRLRHAMDRAPARVS